MTSTTTPNKWYSSKESTGIGAYFLFSDTSKIPFGVWTIFLQYQYVYDSEGNIVRSIDNLAKKEYNYYYEDGKIMRSTQSTVTLNGDIVIAKNLDFIVLYIYDEKGELVRKTIRDADDNELIYKYTNPKDENPVVTLPTGAVSQSKNDKFGRKEFDELQLGRAFMSRHFTYHFGDISCERYEKGSLKSTPTTNLVKEITFQNDRTLKYEYDPEERITKIIDSVDGVTEYTYDAQGQLLTETRNGVVVNAMTYDGYGNILTKNGKSYVYCDNCWGDLLKVYDGQEIVYDAQGNPISYLGHVLTWEKGRQLKSFDNNTYTYNATGIRTSKTVAGVQHTYILDGARILREIWETHTLTPLYDNEHAVCGIIYDGEAYYFYKNKQGDVVEIVDSDAVRVAKYSYDAWGKVNSIIDGAGNDITDGLTHVANVNPFRYCSYYYDTELGMYYLQSRYYDPAIGRFINADDVGYIHTANPILQNIFVYCFNSPIKYTDKYGAMDILGLLDTFFSFLVDCAEQDKNIWSNKKMLNRTFKQIWKDSWDSVKPTLENIRNFFNIFKRIKEWFKRISVFGKGMMIVILVIGLLGIITPVLVDVFNYGGDWRLVGIACMVDICSDMLSKIISEVASFFLNLIPTVGFFLGFAVGIIINEVCSMIFNEDVKDYTVEYCDRAMEKN